MNAGNLRQEGRGNQERGDERPDRTLFWRSWLSTNELASAQVPWSFSTLVTGESASTIDLQVCVKAVVSRYNPMTLLYSCRADLDKHRSAANISHAFSPSRKFIFFPIVEFNSVFCITIHLCRCRLSLADVARIRHITIWLNLPV